DDLRLIMCALDCCTVDELKSVDYILYGKLQGTYVKQEKS
ncbi:type 2 isopentenyl-diphosphate Delta-isomerase, partial [Lactobacillus reuteri]|nr:type 2 isopentenyl-diphosphate Delta-isomerase [Limosilactobacillus reuteri]